MTTIREVRARLRSDALAAGINPRDVDILLADVLGRSFTSILARDEKELSSDAATALDDAVARRRRGEPLQYIRGRCDFYGRGFVVDPRVLIPRPETELLVEHALMRATANARVLDVATGSGCIAVTIALERTDVTVFGCDISYDALAVANKNADSLEADVSFFAGDLLEPVRDSRWDLIVSNPPYVSRKEASTMQTEVVRHEPHGALFAEDDGMAIIRSLLAQSRALLRFEGFLLMEIGFGQLPAVSHAANELGWSVEAFNDLAAIPRVVVLSRR
ncbi:MAG TPA: peptide chain release factor N(5)-glutamine methyltransferase [Thermoanaerobaculia bacterium]|nr:peptide chain release factor N(5)-glutamine methyltransferase [Thermoanaerobaculia bacterium]